MTTLQSRPARPAPSGGSSGPASPTTPNRRDPQARSGRRGTTTLAKSVVEKIAAQAASEVASAGGTSGGFLGIGARTYLSARPKVSVDLFGRTATVAVDLAGAYPTPIRPATDRVRRHLIDRVGALAGVEVTRVDITVTAFHTDRQHEHRDGTDSGEMR